MKLPEWLKMKFWKPVPLPSAVKFEVSDRDPNLIFIETDSDLYDKIYSLNLPNTGYKRYFVKKSRYYMMLDGRLDMTVEEAPPSILFAWIYKDKINDMWE